MDTLNFVKNKYEVPDNAGSFRLNGMLRDDLHILFKELDFYTGCEVGVYRGENACQMLNMIPELTLHCVDSWRPFIDNKSERNHHSNFRKTRRNLKEHIESGRAKIIRKSSMGAVRKFKNESLDFVYIDANHRFDFVMRDIIEWSKKVRVGGIVSGHDYYKSARYGVSIAVNAYVKAHKIKPWFVLDDEVPKQESKNSWFFVKGEIL